MRNRFWLIRNNCPKKHATYNRNITAYDRGLYLQVKRKNELQIRFNHTFIIVFKFETSIKKSGT